MTKFTLRKSSGSNHAVTKFDVVDGDGTICGRITVPNEEADDLARHWLQPQASAAVTPAGGNGIRWSARC
jgi:hypothetical protein